MTIAEKFIEEFKALGLDPAKSCWADDTPAYNLAIKYNPKSFGYFTLEDLTYGKKERDLFPWEGLTDAVKFVAYFQDGSIAAIEYVEPTNELLTHSK